jgi:iron complex transport system substrate-binding protein
VRIVSLVPHATELLFALGLDDEVVGVTHECDYPPAAAALPRVTRDLLQPDLSAREIDSAVRELTLAGKAIYELDADALAELHPDLIVTQALCPVCAVSYEDVRARALEMPSKPSVISLDPHTLGEAMGDVRTIAEATGRRAEGIALVRAAASRIDRVRLAVRAAERPRVAALEWLDPLFVAGHWTPQMIELAGGDDVLGLPAEPSREIGWDELAAAEPEVVVAMPCGYGATRAAEEVEPFAERLRALGAARVVAVDASSYFSRPGPRLVDGLELIAHILHPDLVPDAPAAAAVVEVSAAGTHGSAGTRATAPSG